MSIVRKAVATAVAATPTEVYAPAGGYDGWIDAAVLANTSASDVSVTLWRTTGGGTSTATMILPPYVVRAGETYVASELIGQWALDGGGVSAQASVAGVVALNLSVREFAV